MHRHYNGKNYGKQKYCCEYLKFIPIIYFFATVFIIVIVVVIVFIIVIVIAIIIVIVIIMVMRMVVA